MNLNKMTIEDIQVTGKKVLVRCDFNVPLDAEKYMQWISRGLSYDRILGWLGDSSMLYRWHEFYSRTTEKLAEALSCPLIDLRMPFLMSHRYRDLLSADGIHPTEEGHRLIEETVAKALG